MTEQFLTRLTTSIDDIDFLNAISHFSRENGYTLIFQEDTFISLPVFVQLSKPEKKYSISKEGDHGYDLFMINKLEKISDDMMSETYFRDQILIRKSDDFIVARNMLRYDEVSSLQGDCYPEAEKVIRGSEFDRMDPFGKYLYDVVRRE